MTISVAHIEEVRKQQKDEKNLKHTTTSPTRHKLVFVNTPKIVLEQGQKICSMSSCRIWFGGVDKHLFRLRKGW